jgi:hypothetical protein
MADTTKIAVSKFGAQGEHWHRQNRICRKWTSFPRLRYPQSG